MLCGAAAVAALILSIGLLRERRVARDPLLITIVTVISLDMAFGAVTYAGFWTRLPMALATPPHLYLLLVPMIYLYLSRHYTASAEANPQANPQANRTWVHWLPFVTFHLLRFAEAATKISLPWLSIHEATEYAALGVVAGYCMHLAYAARASAIATDTSELFGRPMLLTVSLYLVFGCYLGRVLTNVLMDSLPVIMAVRFLFIFTSITIVTMALTYWYQRIAGMRTPQFLPECHSQVIKEKYGNNRLPEFVSRSIVHGLEHHMLNDKPWLKVDLTLAQLAQGVNVNSHHLSQTINLHFGKSFACYINEYRVNEACKLLLDSKSKAVLEVALESGFASKSSFNTLFKKQTGLTPSEYRKKFSSRNRAAA